MSFDKQFVFDKIEDIQGYLKELKELLTSSDNTILNDSGKVHIAERLLQLIVDTMLDINQHFIQELNFKPTEDFQSTFYTLGENKIIPAKFAEKIAPVVGLRNRIVHRYDTINKKLFIATLRKEYTDFEKYLKYVEKYLRK